MAAADHGNHGNHGKLYRISQLFLVTATAMDAASSWQQPELNPVLGGRAGTFGYRGIAIKAGIAGGMIAVQALINRHRDHDRFCAVLNFAMGAAYTVVAVRNWRMDNGDTAANSARSGKARVINAR